MGIFCEIIVNKPLDGEFLPGDQVSGKIKYAVDEDTAFNRITVSLKGIGRVKIVDHRKEGNIQYSNTEHYVDIDYVDCKEKEVTTISQGMHEIGFKFELPRDIPSTFSYKGRTGGLSIKCKIMYYIRIKLERPGFLEFSKRFKKEISVRAGLTPTISEVPFETNKQFKLFNMGDGMTIDIKARIENPVVDANDTVRFSYHISNNTNVKLKGVKVKVIEMYTFKAKGLRKVKKYKNVEGTSSKSGPISSGGTQVMDYELNLTPNLCNIQNSVVVSREYFVNVKILLPLFRVNREVKVPFQVGEIIEDRASGFDGPPSYWETMGECKKELSDDDDENDDAD